MILHNTEAFVQYNLNPFFVAELESILKIERLSVWISSPILKYDSEEVLFVWDSLCMQKDAQERGRTPYTTQDACPGSCQAIFCASSVRQEL